MSAYYPRPKQSRGTVLPQFVCLSAFPYVISKPMQTRQKCFRTRHGNLFILGSKDQRSRWRVTKKAAWVFACLWVLASSSLCRNRP